MNKYHQKGQVSFEFIISILLILGIFVFGLVMYESRTDLNYSSMQKWSSNEMAWRISRNINNVYLLDENSMISDYIYWNEKGQRVLFGKTIEVYFGNSSSIAPVIVNGVDWRVTDFNGLIYFRKVSGGVVVSYN